MSSPIEQLRPVSSKTGQILIEDSPDLVLCKPRLIPLKSFTLQKLEKMQLEAQNIKKRLPTANKSE